MPFDQLRANGQQFTMRFRQHQQAAQQQTRQLVLLFVLVVIALVVAVNAVLALVYWVSVPFVWTTHSLPDWFIETNTALVLLFVLGGCWVESTRVRDKGGPHVAELAGARPARPSGNDELSRRERRFVNVVQEMAIASGQRPPPQAWVMPRDDAINALAAGWREDDAVVAVTRGALERLSRAELQGVVAHEFSHLVHGDTRLNMRLVGLVWGLQMIWGLGTSLWSTDERGRRGAGALVGLALMGVGALGWLAGRLLQAAVSRQREFLADASAVKFARHVEGLGGALRKIADQQVQGIKGLATAHAASLSHLLLSDQTLAGRGWRQWLATHPTLMERLTRLYGRSFAADEVLLAADRVALEAEIEPMPRASLVGGSAVLAPAAKVSSPMPLHGTHDTAEATRHDAMQRPEHFDAAERERDALRRIEQWYGLGEWQAAMLALAIDPRASDAAARWRSYAAATADLHVATAVREEVEALRANARLDVMGKLLDRARQSPPLQRQRLLREWKQRRRHPALAGFDSAADQWRAIVIRHAFAPPSKTAQPRGSLATAGDTVRAATRCMSRVLAGDAAAQTRWHDAAIAALEAMGLPPRRSPGGGLAPLTLRADQRELHAALRVRRLAAMQRPLLMRAWMDACGASSPTAGSHDALRFAAAVLDLPVLTPLAEPV